MSKFYLAPIRIFFVIMALAISAPALAGDARPASLYKLITANEEIIVGFNAKELALLGGDSPSVIAGALASKSEVTVWQYAVRKAPNGDLEYAPLRQVSLIANSTRRVEVYKAAISVGSHE